MRPDRDRLGSKSDPGISNNLTLFLKPASQMLVLKT